MLDEGYLNATLPFAASKDAKISQEAMRWLVTPAAPRRA
jgi:hypothetical protein